MTIPPEVIPKRFRDLIGTIVGVDLGLLQDRGFLSCDLRLTGTSDWLPFGLVWRFMTGGSTEPDEETMFQTLTTCGTQLREALEQLTGKVLERVQAQEFLLLQEDHVKRGLMDRNHPLYKEALAAVAKVNGNN